MDRILEVAAKTGASAVHPGYGFLSENTAFATQCQEAGVAFVGPPAAAIAAMGSKSEAKSMMAAAGVPVVPGYHGADQSEDRLIEEGRRMGFPILVKAVMGGGGKGMKLAMAAGELREAIQSAKREAAASFGDDRVLLERFIERPRHIEVQIFADTHDNAVYLFERDCSMQRRHQKVIEEAPAPAISEEFRVSIGTSAVAAAKAVGYVNAGTVEFIVDTDIGDYYFMEMNTRLQVEHPVTEAVTGLDLVEWQLRVAAGQPLPLLQHQLHLQGHAFEARVYAENPSKGFMPSPGSIASWRVPPGSVAFTHHGEVRVDSGVQQGDQVGVNYDPMIAKVIARGPDRQSALRTMHTALSELQVSGLSTNVGFLKRLCQHPAFEAAELDTSFIAKHMDSLVLPAQPSADVLALAAVAWHLIACMAAEKEAARNQVQLGAWGILDSFRLNHTHKETADFTHAATAEPVRLDLSFPRNGEIHVQGCAPGEAHSSKACTVRGGALRAEDSSISAEIDGQRLCASFSVHTHGDQQVLTLWCGGEAYEFSKPIIRTWARTGTLQSAAGTVVSPLPGKVIKVLAKEGDAVEEGDSLVVLEAMKMEHTVRAPCKGVVTGLTAIEGAQVSDGVTLAYIDAGESAGASAA
ncbi:g2699 [Coccomyxa viridis]|uniref:G2699 protein n=1 Tax=Coccomyxa viridis TaxID=1274662 RepID=A0ABP1FPP5_9CHLO